MYDLVRLVRRQQLRFRLFLRVAVDAARIREQARLAEEREAPGRSARAEAVKRAEERLAWALQQCAERAAWVATFKPTCDSCDATPHPGEPCVASSTVKLQRRLRRLAGINPHSTFGWRRVKGSEWAGWNSGPPGFRKCSPGDWDNAVRALEDG